MGMSAVAFEATQRAKQPAALSTLQARHAEWRWHARRGNFRRSSNVGPACTGHRTCRTTSSRDVEYRSVRYRHLRP